MIGKLLLTLLVLALVIVYLRKRHQSRQRQSSSEETSAGAPSAMPVRAQDRGELEQFLSRARNNAHSNKPAANHNSADKARAGSQANHTTQALAPRIRAILWTLMLILLIGGGIASYLHWQDQQRLVTVLLHRDASQPPVIYRVAKRDLGINGFTTDDGTRVTVSANERMEVVGL